MYARNCASKMFTWLLFSGIFHRPTAHVPEPIFTQNSQTTWFRAKTGLGLEEKVLQFFKTFVVILDGSEQRTPWHFVRDNKSSLPFGSHCLRKPCALHAPGLKIVCSYALFVQLKLKNVQSKRNICAVNFYNFSIGH